MKNPPKTLEEAKATSYGYINYGYNEGWCAYELDYKNSLGHRIYGQCWQRPGHGPAGLYCKPHAKMVEGT